MGAKEPEWARPGTWWAHLSSTDTALTSAAVPPQLRRHRNGPCSQRWPALGPAPTWGWQSHMQPLSPASCGQPFSGEPGELAGVHATSMGQDRLGNKQVRERSWSLKLPSFPTGGGTGELSPLAPGPPRPTATNKVQSLGPITATGGGDCMFKNKNKTKKRQKGYSLLQAQS